MKAKIRRSRDGKWYAVLAARNGRVVWTTEMYERRAGAENAIAALGRAGMAVETE